MIKFNLKEILESIKEINGKNPQRLLGLEEKTFYHLDLNTGKFRKKKIYTPIYY